MRKILKITVALGMVVGLMVAATPANAAKPQPILTVAGSLDCAGDVGYTASWEKARVSDVYVFLYDTTTGSQVDRSFLTATPRPSRAGTIAAAFDLAPDAGQSFELHAWYLIRRGKRLVMVGTTASAVTDAC